MSPDTVESTSVHAASRGTTRSPEMLAPVSVPVQEVPLAAAGAAAPRIRDRCKWSPALHDPLPQPPVQSIERGGSSNASACSEVCPVTTLTSVAALPSAASMFISRTHEGVFLDAAPRVPMGKSSSSCETGARSHCAVMNRHLEHLRHVQRARSVISWIWCLQLNPSATISVSLAASRTFGISLLLADLPRDLVVPGLEPERAGQAAAAGVGDLVESCPALVELLLGAIPITALWWQCPWTIARRRSGGTRSPGASPEEFGQGERLLA